MGEATKKHIMISYNWGAKDFAHEIYNALIKSSYRVWMDVEGGMGNDLYKSMAEGVSDAALAVTILTEKYSQSQNCDLEFTSLLRHGVPIIVVKEDGFTPKKPSKFDLGTAGHIYHTFTPISDPGDGPFPIIHRKGRGNIWDFDFSTFLASVDRALPRDSGARCNCLIIAAQV